jgi:hypothetical protein
MCHSNLKDSIGQEASIDTHWRASMHALAARDPYWQASVRAETLANPALQAVIEDKCATCHTPMARFTAKSVGGVGSLFGDGYLNAANKLGALGMDGVSCTLCHQISTAGLGQAASYSGGFDVDAKTVVGQRSLFGPFAITPDQSATHGGVTGYLTKQSDHVTKSEVCATCHTVYTPHVNSKGEVVGTLPEQMVYVEWQNSEYAGSKGCVDCHMPTASGATVIALGGAARTPVRNHVFAGGNAFMYQMLIAGGSALGLTVSSDQLSTARDRVLETFKTGVAVLSLDSGEVKGSTLDLGIKIQPILGHKFPTGFPSRRAWLHVKVSDSNGKVVFESGAYKPDGTIVGNDNDADATKYEPHYTTITKPDEVQIYEPIMVDTGGKVTTGLLKGASYIKDNRLLPPGFNKAKAPADVAVAGGARDDSDFDGGGDTLHYVVDLGDSKGKIEVKVELLYQSIGFRWAENLKSFTGTEITRFTGLYGGVANEPVLVAQVERIF